ncbi:phosphatidylglycerophosphatase A family protein [Nioella nitratireducens]|uniref:phosphatidylglycerophosphatase A family protein n=1 Tax=Nioella nitratireducens TaxID=1287720 RepID=UPI0008FD759F|nr:phosphatidylglycerophosphatase A [Nioella nitratireducens]
MNRFVATFAFVGLLRPAPGTWGSLAAIPVAFALHQLGGFAALLLGTVVVAIVGWWTTHELIRDSDNKDPSEIVIDEVLGMFLALWPVSYGAVMAGASFFALWPGVLTAFVFFRIFDIWKPGPVGLADRRGDALGVMLDDAVAGGLTMLVVVVFAAFSHLVLM